MHGDHPDRWAPTTRRPTHRRPAPRRPAPRGRALGTVVAVLALAALSGCRSQSGAGVGRPGAGAVRVVAAENFWGSIAAQVGGPNAEVTSIITNPNADPHSYEPTTSDAVQVAKADLMIVDGVGYDGWATKLVAADPGQRLVIDIGSLLHLRVGDNPHRWYNPTDVRAVVATITADLSRLRPAAAPTFRASEARFEQTALAPYNALIDRIRARYSGTPVGASESIVAMVAPALGLDLVTPPSFLRDISEGDDVSSADKSTIDAQIHDHRIAIYIYNSQNVTPDVQAQVAECRAAAIPVTTITETLSPRTATYQAWQTGQLQRILDALDRARAR